MTLTEITLADLSPLANHLWQSSLFVVAVWLLTLALKKNRAAVRYWLWLAASVKFLIPFSLLVAVGGRFGLRTAPATTISQPQWSSVVEGIGRLFAVSAPSLQAVAPPGLDLLPTILLIVWLGGFLGSIVLWVRACWKMRATRKDAIPLALGLSIPVLSSFMRVEPGVVGVLRPVLLLPNGITDRLTPTQLNAVLAHEMYHVRRYDNLTAAIHMLVEAIFWFYPLVWWIRARLVAERERACDEAVLQSGSDAEVYAEGILNVCKFYAESPVVCVSGISGSDLRKRIARIMTERAASNLDFSRKLLLGAAGLLAVAAPVVFGLLNATPSQAQSQSENAATSTPVFEVASIKPNKSGGELRIMGTGDRFTATNISLHGLIQVAYGVQDFQISGIPKWMDSENYDIAAKMDSSLAHDLQKLNEDQLKLQNQRMLQALLADRFKLTLHRETKDLPVYALVTAKNGLKIQVSKPGDTYPNGIQGPDGHPAGEGMDVIRAGLITAQAVPMARLVELLSGILGRTILDKTELKGKYDFMLQLPPDDTHAAMFKGQEGNSQGIDNSSPPESSEPSIFTALQEQLGLKLESTKGPVKVLVIDHVDRPSEN
jgi:bla regulator protein blaR1